MIAEMDFGERCGLPCIGTERADLVVAGCAILEAILDIWPAETLGIADRGIREGILRSLMARDGLPAVSRAAAGCGSGSRPPRAARSARPAGSSGSSTIPMSSAPRPRAIAAAPPTSCSSSTRSFGLLKGVKAVVDLGIAPGGWSQVVRKPSPKAAVAGIDLLPTDPIDGVAILQMDFMDDAAPDKLHEALGGPADLVLSDMAANTVGHPQTDHLRTMGLVEAGMLFAAEVLRPGRRLCRQGAGRRRRQQPRRRAEAPLHDREARQAAGEPQGFVGMVCHRAGIQGIRTE